MDADDHLRNVLSMLAELHPGERCRAFEDALAFYNDRHPDTKVVGNPAYTTWIVSEGPLERAFARYASPANPVSL